MHAYEVILTAKKQKKREERGGGEGEERGKERAPPNRRGFSDAYTKEMISVPLTVAVTKPFIFIRFIVHSPA